MCFPEICFSVISHISEIRGMGEEHRGKRQESSPLSLFSELQFLMGCHPSHLEYLDFRDFPGSPVVEYPPANVGDTSSTPGLGNFSSKEQKCLLILWLQSSSAMILEPKKIKSVTVSIVSPSICDGVMGLDAMILGF